MTGHSDFEHGIAHPARHRGLRLSQGPQVVIVQQVRTALDEIIINLGFAEVRQKLQHGVGSRGGIIQNGRTRALEGNGPAGHLLDA